MAGEHHEYDPFHHVLDEKGRYTFFSDLFGSENGYVELFKFDLFGMPFYFSKFMVIEVIAALAIIAIYVPLARRAASGAPPTGIWWNTFESLLTFVRDFIAKPAIGGGEHHHEEEHGHEGEHGHGHHHEDPSIAVDQCVPFLWTVFLFILFMNVFGLVPLLGSPTASIYVTAALALCSFFMLHGFAIAKKGFVPYFKSLWPPVDMPLWVAIPVKPMIFCLELGGTAIKSCVLAIRLFANLFAGHLVLATILGFIVMTNNEQIGAMLWSGITVASVLGALGIMMLELFVAFLQAFVFTYLTAIYIGMQLHPAH